MKNLSIKTLSIVAPNGTRIANGGKTIEVRSWKPELLNIKDLLIVENSKYLRSEGDADPKGLAVAIVKIANVRKFERTDMSATCATSYADGYYSWDLCDVRKLKSPFVVTAKRGIYETLISDRDLVSSLIELLPKNHHSASKH